MSETLAGGRKTQQRGEGRTELQIDSQIEALSAHVAHALAQAKTIPASDDPYGHARSAEIDTAVKLSNTTAKLVTALAKLKGEFNHNVRVTKRTLPTPEPQLEPPLFTPEEWANVTNEELHRRCEERRLQREASSG